MRGLQSDLARCDSEIARCETQMFGEGTNATGALIGWRDWHAERRMIEKEIETTAWPHNLTVYLVTCSINGKKYIGVTKRGIGRRWSQHLADARNGKMTALHRAIREFGKECFSVAEICSAQSIVDLLHLEQVLISQNGCVQPYGFNGNGGGNHFSYAKTPEAIERSAAAHRGRKLSAEHRAAISAFHSGRKKPAGMGAKVAAARRGVPRPQSVRVKLSEQRKGKSFNAGEKNGQAKLSVDQVRETRARLACGESQRSIARSFGIHYNAIWKIANGKKWRSVQ